MKASKLYILTIKHDKGTIRIMTTGSSKKDVIKRVTEIELCPESAIKKVILFK
jgi:hypothetical protein